MGKRKRTRERKNDENAAGINSGCGPICHMMGIEVYTSVNFTSYPASRYGIMA